MRNASRESLPLPTPLPPHQLFQPSRPGPRPERLTRDLRGYEAGQGTPPAAAQRAGRSSPTRSDRSTRLGRPAGGKRGAGRVLGWQGTARRHGHGTVRRLRLSAASIVFVCGCTGRPGPVFSFYIKR